MTTFAPGTAIGSNLRLVRPLAQGGMGSVWIADHGKLQIPVAVKFLSLNTANESAVNRFEQEATTAARIRSPHIVQIFDHGVTPGNVPYLVMELLEGESLGARLQRRGHLSALETAAIVVQTCRALSKAHALQIVHRDIKPDNLFLTDSGGELFVKVLDFGIAKDIARAGLGITQTGATMGTPHYMSPEQITSARSVTGATDLWAVAAVAYRSLTGTLPFQGETYGALAIAIASGRFAPVTRLHPALPETLDPWFARSLAIDPTHRFSSAKELADTFLVSARVSFADAAKVPSGLSIESTPEHAEEGTPASSLAGKSLTLTAQAVGAGAVGPPAAAPVQRPLAPGAGTSPSIAGTVANAKGSEVPPVHRRSKLKLGLLVGTPAALAIGATVIVWAGSNQQGQSLAPAATPSAGTTSARMAAMPSDSSIINRDPMPAIPAPAAPASTGLEEAPPTSGGKPAAEPAPQNKASAEASAHGASPSASASPPRSTHVTTPARNPPPAAAAPSDQPGTSPVKRRDHGF